MDRFRAFSGVFSHAPLVRCSIYRVFSSFDVFLSSFFESEMKFNHFLVKSSTSLSFKKSMFQAFLALSVKIFPYFPTFLFKKKKNSEILNF